METLHSDLHAIETRLVLIETKLEITPAPTRNRPLKPIAGYEEPARSRQAPPNHELPALPAPCTLHAAPLHSAHILTRKQIDRAIAAVDLFAGESGTAVSVRAASRRPLRHRSFSS